MPRHTPAPRSIFPALLNTIERTMLEKLSSDSGVSQSEVVRQLIYREMAQQSLSSAAKPPQPKDK